MIVSRITVDGRVVHLRVVGAPAALDPGDHVGLPQRTAAVELSGVDAGDLLAELLAGARRGKRKLPEVELDVEVRVVHPVGTAEPQRHLDQALP
jgi:hypothetical protein